MKSYVDPFLRDPAGGIIACQFLFLEDVQYSDSKAVLFKDR
jgi:hypothetical protein